MAKKKVGKRPITTAGRNRSELGISADGVVAGKVMNAQTASFQQRGRRVIEFFCGLDVGMDETAICVVDGSKRRW
jgi:hypothetical protein